MNDIMQNEEVALVYYVWWNGETKCLPIPQSSMDQLLETIETRKWIVIWGEYIQTAFIRNIVPSSHLREAERFYWSLKDENREYINKCIRKNSEWANLNSLLDETTDSKAIKWMADKLLTKVNSLPDKKNNLSLDIII